MSKRLTDFRVSRYNEAIANEVSYRVVLNFGEIRKEECSKIITDPIYFCGYIKEESNILEVANFFEGLSKQLKSHLL